MKLAVFGCGKIAHRIAKSINLCKTIEFVGFGSRDINKAKEYSNMYGCKKYGTYDDLLNSDIDAVYIATYNLNHYELIKKCLESKKSVICEKPMLSNIEDTEELFELAKKNNVTLMEALKSVFLPINLKVKELIQNKTIGDLKEISASFMRSGDHPKDHWIQDKKTGGALKDLGTYTVGTLNFLMDTKPTLVKKETDETNDYSDTTAYVTLDYDGVKGFTSVSNSKDGPCSLDVIGEKGQIHVENFWKTKDGYYTVDGIKHELHEELISDFYYELEHFSHLVENKEIESNIMSKQASLNILTITK